MAAQLRMLLKYLAETIPVRSTPGGGTSRQSLVSGHTVAGEGQGRLGYANLRGNASRCPLHEPRYL